jgi:DNA invertase Pin-like site-specific DNA recombinase
MEEASMTTTTFVTPGIGIYTRKSTDKQGELSLPAQERICRKIIVEPLGLPVYRVYKDILSGQRPDRTDYQEMLADARSGRLRMVVFHKVNRFGRDAAEGLAAIQELRKLGLEIRIADLPTLDLRKPEGMFIFTFLLGQGQYEVENLGNEARKGMQEKIEQGGWPFLAPDGYQNRREEIAPRKFHSWVAVDRHRAALVRLMYRWYARGDTTLRGTVRRLNQLHEQRSAQGKSGCLRRSAKRWDIQSVYRVLTNRFYVGEVIVDGWGLARPGKHPPIIRRALFDRVQQFLTAHGHGAMQRHVYLLQGVLWLDGALSMQSTTVMRQGRPYTYYYRYTEAGRRVYYAADRIEQQVLQHIQMHITTLGDDPTTLLRQRLSANVAELRQRAHKRLDAVALERQRILHFAGKGKFTEAEVDAELNRLDTERVWAEREVDRAQTVKALHTTLLADAVTDLATFRCWADVPFEEQYQLIARMIRQVESNTDGTVINVVWQPLWELLWFIPQGPTIA